MYLTGHSNGCYMAQRYVADVGGTGSTSRSRRKSKIAALGCFSAHLVEPLPIPREYTGGGLLGPVPIMIVHGT